MSPLTKTFVLLLVVTSMLTSAATVVFVNKLNVTQASVTDMQKLADDQKKLAAAANAQVQELQAAMQRNTDQASAQSAVIKASLDTANSEIAKLNVELVNVNNQASLQKADNGRLTDGLRAAQDVNGNLIATVTDLRSQNDKLVKTAGEDNRQIADLTNRVEASDKELAFAKEQLQAAQEKLNKVTSAYQQKTGTQPDLAAIPNGAGPTPAINGIVRDKRDIGGVTYVTISVGSAQAVTKGMEFNVVDRNQGKFLGVVTIDSVEADEATGRLTGPTDTVSMVRPGSEVRTTFQ